MKRSRSLSDMVRDVEQALQSLDEAKEFALDLEKQLSEANHEVQMRLQDLASVRDALQEEYPEIMGTAAVPVPEAVQVSPDTGYKVVEVDDEDDPRYTAGVGPGPSGPIEFEERG